MFATGIVGRPLGYAYDQYTKLLMHMDGGNGSTTFTDSSQAGRSFTNGTSATQSTTQYKFGVSAFYSAQDANKYVYTAGSSDWAFGTGDFTVECWVYSTRTTPIGGIIAKEGATNRWGFEATNNGNARWLYPDGTTSGQWGLDATNTWVHIAAVRTGGQLKIYRNGVSQSFTGDTDTRNYSDSSGNLTIGAYTSDGSYWVGYIDEVRVSKGIARYTSNFTPATVPFDP